MKNPLIILLAIIVIFSALIAMLVKSFHGEVNGNLIDNSKTVIKTDVDNHSEDNQYNTLNGGGIRANDITIGGK